MRSKSGFGFGLVAMRGILSHAGRGLSPVARDLA
jgi:hypothetical protein